MRWASPHVPTAQLWSRSPGLRGSVNDKYNVLDLIDGLIWIGLNAQSDGLEYKLISQSLQRQVHGYWG